MGSAFTYDVFLSYHWRDHAHVEYIARWLRSKGLKPFVDRWYLTPGRPWMEALENVLRDCGAVAVCIGPGEMGPWQQREKNLALERQTKDPTLLVIPILFPGSDAVLGFLSQNTWVDLSAGVDDPMQLERLSAAISRQDFGPEQRRSFEETLAGICPYRGLLYFREEDSAFFFGRDLATAKLVTAIEQRNFVAVVGASGSGKSSVVRAGLIPVLRRRADPEYEILTLVPTDRPLHELARTFLPLLEPQMTEADRLAERDKLAGYLALQTVKLRDIARTVTEKQANRQRLLLIVDQWEELYTLTQNDEWRRRFIDELLDSTDARELCVVLTLRGDFVGRALTHRALSDRLQDAQINLGPMTPAELEGAIRTPAEKTGLIFQPGLAQRILDDVGDEPGNLPLLEFVLKRLWEGRVHGEMRHAVYDAMGQLQGAVASKAEEVFAQLSEKEQQTVQHVFLQLVRPGVGADDTRRRATLREIGADATRVVYKLADARLLVTGRAEGSADETVEVSHETLIQNWRRLKSWLDEDREFLSWQDWLRSQVGTWLANDKDEGALLRGALLSNAQRWLAERRNRLQEHEQEYIERGTQLRSQEEQERLARELKQRELAHSQELAREQERRAELERSRANERALTAARLGRQRIALVVMLVAIVGLAITTGVLQRDRMLSERRTFGASRLAVAADQSLATDPELSTLLAVKAVALTRAANEPVGPGALSALARAIHTITPKPTVVSGSGELFDVSFSPDGLHFATGGADGVVRIWDRATGRELAAWVGHEAAVTSVAFAPDGRRVASGSRDGTARIWDSHSGAQIAKLWKHGSDVFGVAFSADGLRLATASKDTTVKIWSVNDGHELVTLYGHVDKVYQVAFSPSGKRVVTGSADGTVRIWDSTSGQQLMLLRAHNSDVLAVAYDHAEQHLISGGRDTVARIWSTATGKEQQVLNGHRDSVASVAFDRNGTKAATASYDHTVRIWSVDTGQALAVLSGHRDKVECVAFSPDAAYLATASGDGTAKVWDVSSLRNLLSGHLGSVTALAYSPGSDVLATASSDYTLRLWDPKSGQLLNILSGHRGSVADVAFSPDGRHIATASDDGTANIWDSQTGQRVSALRAHQSQVTGVAYSHDGRYIATAGKDGALILWDGKSYKPLKTALAHEGGMVLAVAFSPRTMNLATAGFDNTAKIWDVSEQGELALVSKAKLEGHSRAVYALAFSPDGAVLATGSGDHSVVLWDSASGKAIARLDGHQDAVTGLAFSPDGKRLLTVGTDATVRLWDVLSRNEVSLWLQTDAPLKRVAYRPDGNQAAIARMDGLAQLLDSVDLTPKTVTDMITMAQGKVTRVLTPAECAHYSGGVPC